MNLCIKAETSQQQTGSLWRKTAIPSPPLFLSTTTPLTTSFRHVGCDTLLLTGWDTSAANPAGKYCLVLLVQFACLPWKILTSHKQSENAVLVNSYSYRWQFLNDGSEKQATCSTLCHDLSGTSRDLTTWAALERSNEDWSHYEENERWVWAGGGRRNTQSKWEKSLLWAEILI